MTRLAAVGPLVLAALLGALMPPQARA